MGKQLAVFCAAAGFSLAVGCSGDSGQELLAGFEPAPPAAGQIQIISPIARNILPGQDITLCSYLPKDQSFDKTYDIVDATGEQSKLAAHHAVLSMAAQERPVDTHECNDDDMTNSRFLAGAGGGDVGGTATKIPDGVAFRVEAKQQLMIQSHWINTTDKPIDGQSAFNLTVTAPSDQHSLAQLFTWTSTNISIPANGTASAHTTCTLKRDMQFYRIGGHAHEHGTHVTMTWTQANAGANPVDNVFYDEPWQPAYTFAPPTLEWTRDQAILMHSGDSLSIDCNYSNDTSGEIVFPLEMCTGFGFYFPGTVQADCTNGDWPSELN